MKKKSSASLLLKICILFTTVILLSSFLLYCLTISKEQQETFKPVEVKLANVDRKDSLRTANVPVIDTDAKAVIKQQVVPTALKAISPSSPVQVTTGETIHFIHIPKCGGTTMTTLLREIQCKADSERNKDCCLNPGFCDWHAHRRCSTIMGCINHFPNRKLIYKPMRSIAVFREPLSRLLSAWFYRGHSPNNDFFQVRPEFKEIREGKRPQVSFEEYLDMHEYQNIQTRMLGADSFPYRNITVTEEIYNKAIDSLDHLFFIGLQEEYQISSELLIREMNMLDKLPTPEIKKERDQNNPKMTEQKLKIKNNNKLMNYAKEKNLYDIRLYQKAVEKFCQAVRKYPDLYNRVIAGNKVHCDSS